MILLKGGTVVKEDLSIIADVLLHDGSIKDISSDISQTQDMQMINCKGKHIMCGFVDIHTHLREPGGEHKETILSGTSAALKGGFTTVAAMPNTNPVNDNVFVTEFILSQAKKANNAKVLPVAAISKGLNSDILCDYKALKAAGVCALSDDGQPALDAKTLYNCLCLAKELNLPVLCHSEDKSLSQGGVVNFGNNSVRLGLKGIPASSEAVGIARDIILAEELGCKIHICHVSTTLGLNLIRDAKRRNVQVTCETAPHYFSLSDDILAVNNTNAKVNPPLRANSDIVAIIQAIKDETIDIIATDHAPHSQAEKQSGFEKAPFGISGLETAFAVSYTYLVRNNHIDLCQLSKMLSTKPCEVINVGGGVLQKGAAADIVIVDLNKKWTVEKEEFLSKGKNTPFQGMELFGKVIYTFVNGVLKYKFEE